MAVVPVCFESIDNPTVGTGAGQVAVASATVRSWIEDAIRSNWGRWAKLMFSGWGQCQVNAPGIRIRLADVLPPKETTSTGFKLVELPNWGPTSKRLCSDDAWERCTRGIALHEFGHAIGFFHQEERPDFSRTIGDSCQKDGAFAYNGQYYGAYDINSVMSTCGAFYKAQPLTVGQPADWVGTEGWKVELSPGDIASVQKAYGQHQAGSLMSRTRCLSAHWYNPGSTGNYPFLYDCDEYATGQEWWPYFFESFPSATGVGFYVVPNLANWTGAWLDGFYGQFNPVEIRDRNLTGHSWKLSRVRFLGFGGLCLDAWDGAAPNGSVRVAYCAGTQNPPGLGGVPSKQQWDYDYRTGLIRLSSDPSKCLRVRGAAATGATLFLGSCDTDTFVLSRRGEIQYLGSWTGKCLDVRGPTEAEWLSGIGLPDSGAIVQLFDCARVLGQQWHMRAAFQNLRTGQCLDWNHDSQFEVPYGTTCNGGPWQDWDYHFGALSY